MSAATPPERVVLLDEHRRPVGTADKREVHHTRTPLHLAFSCYVFDGRGNVLVTRRALAKRTWPGVWTNSFCGHPAPGEALPDAVRRRARHELGLDLAGVELVLPDFAYQATAPDGTVENEFCPVFRADAAGDPLANPDEVLEWRWIPWPELAALGRVAPWTLSPWAAEQLPLLAEAFAD